MTQEDDTTVGGALYRLARADAGTLRELVAAVAGWPCWSFGGSSLWEVVRASKPPMLRPIAPARDAAQLDLSGDFGHAFSVRGEVRWKRIDAMHYDALALPAGELMHEGLTTIGHFATRAAPEVSWMYLELPGSSARLGYVEYIDANRAVRLVRYTELREEVPA